MAGGIPDDVLDGLKTAFEEDADKLSRAIYFLSDNIAKGTAEPYIRSLQSVVSTPAVFKKVAERMVEDTKTAETDPRYRRLMYNVWNGFLKENLSEHPDRGQRLELMIQSEKSLIPVVQFNFMRAVYRLPPASFTALSDAVQAMGGPVALVGGRALAVARKAQPIVRVALITVALAIDVIKNLKRWWNGEITGERCAKNIIDCGVGVASGIGGGIVGETMGAWVGSALFGPIGMAFGAVFGAVSGGALAAWSAETLCDRLTQWAFGLPKSEALENAYNFLDVSPNASNGDINSRYRQLALQNHPDKGGDAEKWTRLQYSMAIIREARGEP